MILYIYTYYTLLLLFFFHGTNQNLFGFPILLRELKLRFLLVEIKIGISASRILNGASSSADCNFDFDWVIDLH